MKKTSFHINYIKEIFYGIILGGIKYPNTEYERNLLQDYNIPEEYTGKFQKSFKPGRSVIFMVDGKICLGGLADRLKGLLTCYYFSKKYNKDFFVYWISPFNLTDYLVPNKINWIIDEGQIQYDRKVSLPISGYSSKNDSIIKKKLKYYLFKSSFRLNKDLHIYSNYYQKKDFPNLFNELFQPSFKLEKALKEFKSKNCEGKKYWSYTFRFLQLLGDFKDCGDILPEEERQALLQKNLDELKRMLKELPLGYKAFVTSDSITFLNQVKEIDKRIFIVPGTFRHPSHVSVSDSTPYEFMKSFMDFYLIMGAEKVYRFKTGNMYASGFPKLAALLSMKEFVAHNF